MTHKFDLFRIESESDVLWLEAAATLEHAKARVQEFAAQVRAAYLILDQKTGAKIIIDDKMGEAPKSDASNSQGFSGPSPANA